MVGPLLTAGALGVDLFFVLSGFVIAYTYLDQLGPALRAGATARFVWARACRLWPAYALVFHLFGLWLAARLYFGSDDQIAFQAMQPVLSVGEYLAAAVHGAAVGQPAFRRRLLGGLHLVDQCRVAGLPAVPGGRARVLPAAHAAGRGARRARRGGDDPDGLGLPVHRQPVLRLELAGPHPERLRRRGAGLPGGAPAARLRPDPVRPGADRRVGAGGGAAGADRRRPAGRRAARARPRRRGARAVPAAGRGAGGGRPGTGAGAVRARGRCTAGASPTACTWCTSRCWSCTGWPCRSSTRSARTPGWPT